MAKTYQITGANGKAKASWEEIICDFIEISDAGVVKFYQDDPDGFIKLLICYKLSEGEALIYVGEE